MIVWQLLLVSVICIYGNITLEILALRIRHLCRVDSENRYVNIFQISYGNYYIKINILKYYMILFLQQIIYDTGYI